ncbi:MAG: CocE/NonD family hydrolase [Acidobacteria bacterium]|nr:CocE/NonD family hydrolase [Acidobacteriota bacterium]
MIRAAAVLVALTLRAQAEIDQRLGVRIPMRDGVRLSANIFLPAPEGRWPALLVRTPYSKGREPPPQYRPFAGRGYVVVVQDVRGRHESEGAFRPFEQEAPDGDDTLNWMARQPWCNGRIGMLGGSYSGMAQWKAATTANPHLKAIFPVVSGVDDYTDRFYSTGGAIKLGHRLQWLAENLRAPGFPLPGFSQFVHSLPVRNADRAATGQRLDIFQAALDHPHYDSFWRAFSVREQLHKVRAAVFSVGGWFDNNAQSELEAFAAMRRMGRPHRILIGPWPHNMSQKFPNADFGPEAMEPIRRYQLEWFDYWLKGEQKTVPPPAPAARFFLMGENRWHHETDWPPARSVPTAFYLDSAGQANTADGDGSLLTRPARRDTQDAYTYNPRDPVPTEGGPVCCNPQVFPWGPRDQRKVEARRDVLVYSSPVLREGVEVTGPVRAVLWVSTSTSDTDFTAKLVDVMPSGEYRGITDGILRLRYREGLDRAVLAKPGEVYRIALDLGVTSHLFEAGHRIRVEVSSSNFPRFDRNPNTGRPIADETELRPASQVLYHGRKYPSHLMLPVAPR